MKKLCASLIIGLTFLFHFQKANAQVIENDPDMPKIAAAMKDDYLKNREAYTNMKRGFNKLLPYNARLNAIAEMNMQLKNAKKSPTNILSPNWVELGPSPIPNGQTDSATVPVSGRVTAIAVHNTNPNIVYVGTANGGVFRTMDGGTTWTAIFDGGASLAIGALALAPSNNSILYVGTGEANLSADSYAGVGLYRIDNADATPSLVGPIDPPQTFTALSGGGSVTTGTFTFRSISKILVDPTNPANIFVSTSTGVAGNPGITPSTSVPPTALVGLYRSTNATAAAGALTFKKLTVTTFGSLDNPGTGNRRINDMVMEPGNPNNILCWVYGDTTVNDGGVFRTTNALAANPTFTQVLRNTVVGATRATFSIVKQGTDIIVYLATGESPVGTSCTTGSGALRKSRDGGLTWSAKLSGGGGFCGSQCFYDMSVAVSPTDSTRVLLGGSSSSTCSKIMQVSTNAGLSFAPAQTLLHADSHVTMFAPSNSSIVYAGNDGGIFKSTDGGSHFTSINNSGFKATQFQSLAISSIDANLTIGGTQDNGTNMRKSNGTFTRIDFGDGGNSAIDQNPTDNLHTIMYHTYFNQTSNLIAYVINDQGENAVENTWGASGCFSTGSGAVSHNGISCFDNVLFYAPLTLGPGSPNTIYFGTDRLYRSDNFGDTNIVVSQAPISAGNTITSIAVSQKDDNIRIVGLSTGAVWATTSGAHALTNVTPPITFFKEVGRVAYDSAADIAYVTYGGYGMAAGQHIWKCANLNTPSPTWTSIGTGIPDVPVNAFAIDPKNSNVLYAGTDIGVFQSQNGGASWVSFNNNLPAVPIFDMVVHPVTRVLRVATHGRGLWETATLGTLPVSFLSLSATPRKFGEVFVEWFTSSEFNNKGFEIQRAVNTGLGIAEKWTDVAFIPGSGTSTRTLRYNSSDYPTGGNKFLYRIKQIDFDGNTIYSDIKEVELKDFDYALFQNAPNPSNVKTVIKYQIPVPGNVNIAVFNSAGALVKTLVNEQKPKGIYEVMMNTQNIPSGNYFYKLTVNDFFISKQMTITK